MPRAAATARGGLDVPGAVLRDLSGGNAFNAVLGAVLLSAFFLLTLYLQQVRGDSAPQAGLAYLPLAAAEFLGSGVCSQLLPRLGHGRCW